MKEITHEYLAERLFFLCLVSIFHLVILNGVFCISTSTHMMVKKIDMRDRGDSSESRVYTLIERVLGSIPCMTTVP